MISSSDLKEERTSSISLDRQDGFLRSRKRVPVRLVAVVSDPATMLSNGKSVFDLSVLTVSPGPSPSLDHSVATPH